MAGNVQSTVAGSSATGSSSGNSGDERWYDFGDVPPSSSENSPPPLPNRALLGGGKGSAFQKVNGQNGTTNVIISNVSNVTVSNGHSSSNNSSPSIYQHPPAPMKVQHAPTGGIYNQANKRVTRKYSYPTTTSSSSSGLGEEKREAKVTYLTEFELNNQPNLSRNNHHHNNGAELHNGNNSNHVKNSDMESVASSNMRSHHHGSRYHIRSEDELSAVSTSEFLDFLLIFYFSINTQWTFFPSICFIPKHLESHASLEKLAKL